MIRLTTHKTQTKDSSHHPCDYTPGKNNHGSPLTLPESAPTATSARAARFTASSGQYKPPQRNQASRCHEAKCAPLDSDGASRPTCRGSRLASSGGL